MPEAPALWEHVPLFAAMAALIVVSGFFSASEAALFYLGRREREAMQQGTRSEQLAARLLDDPDRLLSAVLFWNLLTNITYFALASITGLKMQLQPAWLAGAYAAGSVLAIIFCSEMLPKSAAVLSARRFSACVAGPLAFAVRCVDPLMPLLRTVNILSRRLLWPSFQPEPYLELADLERAIELSQGNAELVEQEQAALSNVVLLSDIRVEEWMRPRTQFMTFRPPVSLQDLEGRLTPSGYLLVSEADSDEVTGAIHLPSLPDVPDEHLEHYAEPVVHVPWCSTAAFALEQMQKQGVEVATVVNEFGETIGVLTFGDVMNTVFSYQPSRSRLLLNRKPIHYLGPDTWLVAGVTSLRRLSRYLNMDLPSSKCVTVAGVVQDALQRTARQGDVCSWGPLRLEVIEAPQRGLMLIEVRRREAEAP